MHDPTTPPTTAPSTPALHHEAAPQRSRGLRGLWERIAAPLGNGDDMVDDLRGWRSFQRQVGAGER